MKKNDEDTRGWKKQYERLRESLVKVGPISRGSVQDRTGRTSGKGYQWTRKLAGKTVTVALTPEQFQKMKEAVAHYRALQKILTQMEKLSRQMIFESSPHPARRKTLSKKVLGLI